MRTKILGVGIDMVNRKEALQKVLSYISMDEKKCRMLITPNPEIVMRAQTDKELSDILRKADMVIPDGVGLVWASKYSKVRLLETVPGCDLCLAVFDSAKSRGVKAYFLGAKPGVSQLAKSNMEEKYPGLNVCGYHHGYFDEAGEESIINEINTLSPDILLVGLGGPRQEKWIDKHKNRLSVNVAVGCGGTIDIMAGTVKRAPRFFINHGLEWFYRLISQPSRFFRMLNLPKFVIVVICDYYKSGRKKA